MLTNPRFDGRLIIDSVTQGYDLMMIIPKRGGLFFFKGDAMKEAIPFTKAATSIDEQVNILRSRGLAFPSAEAKLRNMLLHNNYYRLKDYWFRYYAPASYPYHEFQPGTSFERILADYQGDAELRHCTFRLLEVIEISFRSVLHILWQRSMDRFHFPWTISHAHMIHSYPHTPD